MWASLHFLVQTMFFLGGLGEGGWCWGGGGGDAVWRLWWWWKGGFMCSGDGRVGAVCGGGWCCVGVGWCCVPVTITWRLTRAGWVFVCGFLCECVRACMCVCVLLWFIPFFIPTNACIFLHCPWPFRHLPAEFLGSGSVFWLCLQGELQVFAVFLQLASWDAFVYRFMSHQSFSVLLSVLTWGYFLKHPLVLTCAYCSVHHLFRCW